MSTLWSLSPAKVPKTQHRTYRAPGQMNPHMSSPCPIKTIPPEKEQTVPKPDEEVAQRKKITQKKLKKTKPYGSGVNSAQNNCRLKKIQKRRNMTNIRLKQKWPLVCYTSEKPSVATVQGEEVK